MVKKMFYLNITLDLFQTLRGAKTMQSKKTAMIIITVITIVVFGDTNLFAHDSDVQQIQTRLCSYCDNWFITTDTSQHLCPRCELLKDLTLLKSDPHFNSDKLEPPMKYVWRELDEKIESLKRSLWPKPNLRLTNTY